MTVNIHEMQIEDYHQIYSLWEMSDNIGLSKADSEHSIRSFPGTQPGHEFHGLERR